MTEPATAEVWLLDDPDGRSALASFLPNSTPLPVREWLSSAFDASTGAAVATDLPDQFRQAADALGAASDALIVVTADARDKSVRSSTIVHDGEVAVRASGGATGPAALSSTVALRDVVGQLADDVAGDIGDGESDTLLVHAGTLIVLLTVFSGRELVTLDEIGTSLARVAEFPHSAQAVADALVASGLAEREGEGIRIAAGEALSAIASGSALRIDRASLSREGAGAYDPQTVEFLGMRRRRYLVSAVPETPDVVALVRRPASDVEQALWAHAMQRREPAWLPVAQDEATDVSAQLISGDRLTISPDTFSGEMDSTLATALLEPPATVMVRREEWDRSIAEGIAIWPTRAVGWCWRAGHGYAHVVDRPLLPAMLADLIGEHLNQPTLGGLHVSVTVKESEGYSLGVANLERGDDGWVGMEGSDGSTHSAVASDIAEAVLAEAGVKLP